MLSTLTPSDDWTIHANLGVAHSRDAHRTGGILGVAAVWTPAEPLLLFTETKKSAEPVAAKPSLH